MKTELGVRSKSIKPEELSRKERVLQLVKSGKCDTVTEISRELSLSKMSVYRYVRTLMGEGKISKTFNKLYPYAAGLSAAGKDSSALSVKCGICSKQITDERLKVVATYKDGGKQDFCCAHCAVMAAVHTISDLNSVSSIMGRDFIYGNPLDLRNAFLLFKTGVIPCCSPPILVFARKDDAEKFKKGFGGEIRSFDEIISHMKF
ncbi:MAG: helix-turn-helix domain-containing protein [Deltaproteobacteria bacterium]|nr:helix-turn-helix domain-containing protein [Deltaproteobacteria bacterium]MCL5892587.1 helix-turn-helix domain-containing protein [Deltaproteobacteria bacterium]